MSVFASLLAGLLAAWVFIGGVGIGASVWSLIGRLTGGAWSEAPALVRLRALVLWAMVPALVCRAALAFVLPPATVTTALYLSPLLLIPRLVLAGLLWGWIARATTASKLAAAIGLALHGLVLSVMAVDLITSLEPNWISTAEGMGFALRQLGSALALALLLSGGEQNSRASRDLTGLLVATLLGTLYLNLMSYVVPWYGDLAEKTAWIRLRSGVGWRLLIGLALGGGALLPLALIGAGRRIAAPVVRIAAGLALVGFLGQTVWLIAPGFGLMTVLTAVTVALIAGGVLILPRSAGRLAHAG